VAREDAVLTGERHEIGDGAEGDEVEMIAELDAMRDRMIFRAQLLKQAVAKLEHEADRAEVAPRGVAVRLVGVDVRVDEDAAVERALARAMMIDHEHVDALRLEIGGFLVRVRAAIERDEKFRFAGLERAVDRAARKP